MDSPRTSLVPFQRPVRCLFPQEQASIPNVSTQPVPVHPQAIRVSATDIIKVPNTNDSLSSDDSGTDALHIALEDSSSDDTPHDLSAGNNKHKDDTPDPHTEPSIARIPLVKQPMFAHSSPLISEYPRPALSFYHAPPPTSSFTPLHTQLPPVMFPSSYPGFLPYQSRVFSHLHTASHTMTLQHPTETSRVLSTSDGSDGEGNDSDSRSCSPPSSRDQTSPANSFTSSGVYSNPSPVPSPIPSPDPSPVPSRVSSPPGTFDSVPSPVKTPVAHTRPRAPGGRTCYAPNQVRVMEKAFVENKYPDYDVLEKMSAELEIPVKKIKVWFQNKRARNKSRYPDMPAHNMPQAASMSAVGYGYLPGAMPLLFTGGPHMMPFYPGYPYPGMYPSPIC